MARDATGSVMRAGDVGRAARRDLQFRIPRRPVVRLGLRARPEETGWIIDGARKSQVLGGAFAREHMGPLLQACDGTRTLDEIGEVTGIGPQAAFEAVSLLWTGGIVEEGDTIAIDIPSCTIELKISQEEYDRRMAAFEPKRKRLSGYLRRYAQLVSSGATGAVLN